MSRITTTSIALAAVLLSACGRDPNAGQRANTPQQLAELSAKCTRNGYEASATQPYLGVQVNTIVVWCFDKTNGLQFSPADLP